MATRRTFIKQTAMASIAVAAVGTKAFAQPKVTAAEVKQVLIALEYLNWPQPQDVSYGMQRLDESHAIAYWKAEWDGQRYGHSIKVENAERLFGRDWAYIVEIHTMMACMAKETHYQIFRKHR